MNYKTTFFFSSLMGLGYMFKNMFETKKIHDINLLTLKKNENDINNLLQEKNFPYYIKIKYLNKNTNKITGEEYGDIGKEILFQNKKQNDEVNNDDYLIKLEEDFKNKYQELFKKKQEIKNIKIKKKNNKKTFYEDEYFEKKHDIIILTYKKKGSNLFSFQYNILFTIFNIKKIIFEKMVGFCFLLFPISSILQIYSNVLFKQKIKMLNEDYLKTFFIQQIFDNYNNINQNTFLYSNKNNFIINSFNKINFQQYYKRFVFLDFMINLFTINSIIFYIMMYFNEKVKTITFSSHIVKNILGGGYIDFFNPIYGVYHLNFGLNKKKYKDFFKTIDLEGCIKILFTRIFNYNYDQNKLLIRQVTKFLRSFIIINIPILILKECKNIGNDFQYINILKVTFIIIFSLFFIGSGVNYYSELGKIPKINIDNYNINHDNEININNNNEININNNNNNNNNKLLNNNNKTYKKKVKSMLGKFTSTVIKSNVVSNLSNYITIAGTNYIIEKLFS